MVQLDFQGQAWLPVLEWLAEKRHLNLDWQQLPEGTLNLVSTKKYHLEEAEDQINMQLLARGFTLLQSGEVLRVVPLKNIDVTLVPRVSAEDLAKLPPYRFVRVTFPLTWMIADEAATEFKPLVSPYGQLSPMASSNRLEAMDAVANLRELYRLLTQAEGDETRRERVAEFRLKYRKAEEVAVQVRQLLGLPPDITNPTSAVQTQLDIENAKFKSEAVKQLGANAKPLLSEKPTVHLVVNSEENSILVNGRPDKIEIAHQAIEALDRPESPRESSWETLSQIKTYSVEGFDPATVTQLMQTLQQNGNLGKETRIQHEAAYNRLVVFGSPEDQVTIAGIIDSFRTEGRRAEVLQLEQLDTQYATKAVQLVLKNPDRPSATPGDASDGKFQIEPDPDHNRLLLWATPHELQEVRDFLTGLGETFASSGRIAPRMHVVPLRGVNAAAVMDRLKRVWKEISDAPLIIESGVEESPPTEPRPLPPPPPAKPATGTNPQPPPKPMIDRPALRTTVLLAAQESPAPAEAGNPKPVAAPKAPAPVLKENLPVRVIAEKDDKVIILSRDPKAAEAAKDFIEEIVPSDGEVKVIPLKHAQAAVVKTQIESLLASSRTGSYSALNSELPIVIEADSRTNHLMVQHASPRQIELINEIVPVLDQPEQGGEQLARKQQIYHAQRKRASEIAQIVKDVYRDLLSTSDKVFDARAGNRPYGYNQALAATSKSPEYAGLLSVGADDVDNTLVLSAPAYLIDEVMQMVKLVDEDANGERVVVVPVRKAARPNVAEALNRLLAAKPK